MNSQVFRSLAYYCAALAVFAFGSMMPQAQTKRPVPIYDPQFPQGECQDSAPLAARFAGRHH